MAYGTPTNIAKSQSSGALTRTPTFPSNLSAGGLCFMVYGGRTAMVSVVDTGLQTWSKLLTYGVNGAVDCVEVWTAPVSAPGTAPTVTVTHAFSDWISVIIFEVPGLDLTGTALDAHGEATSGSAQTHFPVTASSNSGASNEFVLLAGFSNGGGLWTTASGFTAIDAFNNPLDVKCWFKSSTSGVAEAGDPNLGSSEFCAVVLGVWKLAAASAANRPPALIVRQAVQRAAVR